MKPVYFVHFSDTHIGPTADYARHGHRALPGAQKMVEIINTLPTRPDFVVHTGDVVTDPHPDSYALAAELFATVDVPIYYATGNHDTAADIHRYLPMGHKQDLLDSPHSLSYAFECRGIRFVVVDARGPDEIDPHGLISEEQMAVLSREAAPDGLPLVVFTHYAALPLNAPWGDANLLILNGMDMHETLLPARDRLRGVFYGHIHQPRQTVRDGIVYTSAASTVGQFTSWPTEEKLSIDPAAAPGYNFVQLLDKQTIVQFQTFQQPEGELL